jgi:hypothetical protein
LIRPHLQFAGSPDVFLRYLLQPQPGVHIPTVRRPKRLFPGSALRLAGAAVTIRMRAGATAPATLSLPGPAVSGWSRPLSANPLARSASLMPLLSA